MRAIVILILLGIAWYSHAATVTSDTVTMTLCSDGLYYSGGCNTPVAGFFWGEGGNDVTGNGLTHANRYRTLAPIMAKTGVAVGTDIWGFEGSTHTVTTSGLVSSKWAGTEANPVVWGTYYLEGGTPTAVWEGASGGDLDLTSPNALTENTAGSHTLATIKGALTDACIAAKNCNWNLPIFGECATMDSAIVSISHSYQSFRGMKVSHSSCRGMTIWPGVYGVQDGRLLGFEFWNSIADKNGRQAHLAFVGIKYSLIHDSIIRNNQQCSLSRYSGGTSPSAASDSVTQNSCANPTSTSIFQLSSNSFSGFVNNTLIFNYGENLHCLNVTKFLFRNNRVYNGLKIMYSDACGGAIVERNMLTPFNANGGYGPGTAGASTFNGFFEINSEFNQWQPSPAPTDMLIRANIMIGGSHCSAWSLSAAAATGGEQIGGKFYHNTCIAQVSQTFQSGYNLNDTLNLGISNLNNVFAAPTTTSADVCTGADVAGNYNVYAKAPTATSCKGANDINASAATDTLLTLPVGTSSSPNAANIATWRTSDYDNPPDHENARPTAGTYVGTRLNNVQCISDADLVEWQHIFDLMVDPPTPAAWKMCAAEYFDGEAIPESPVMGALKN